MQVAKFVKKVVDYSNEMFDILGLPDEKIYLGNFVAPRNVMKALFQAGFFNLLCKQIMHQFFGKFLFAGGFKEIEGIFGVLAGIVTDDFHLIRSSLVQI